MVNRVYRLSSTKEGFAKECNKLRTMFSKLRYPKTLVDSTTNKFSQEPDKEIHTVPSVDPSVYIVLPFKDQRSADRVRKDIYSLGAKINVNVKPHFYKQKTVGYTARHLHQRISEHRYSAIGKHLETQHGNNRTKTDHLFKVLRK